MMIEFGGMGCDDRTGGMAEYESDGRTGIHLGIVYTLRGLY